MPRQAAPGNNAGEKGDDEPRDHNYSHGLADGEPLCKKGVRRLPRRDIQRSALPRYYMLAAVLFE